MRPHLFLDTNVVIDFFQQRMPFHNHAVKIISLAEKGEIFISCSAITIATAHYVLKKSDGKNAIDKVRRLKTICLVMPTMNFAVDKALTSNFTDLEDALQYFTAVDAKADFIISRDNRDFINSEIPVLTPEEFFAIPNLNRD